MFLMTGIAKALTQAFFSILGLYIYKTVFYLLPIGSSNSRLTTHS